MFRSLHRRTGRGDRAPVAGALRRPLVTALLAALATVLAPGSAAAGPPEGACIDPEPARPPVSEEPWAQRTLAPERVWPHSTGTGVLVAVVGTGVDAEHPQLSEPGTVLAGEDFYLVGDLPGNFDCSSHGTAVASIIAAASADGVGFAGLAPGASILPVRVSEREVTGERIDPEVLADGIRYAADEGAQVINLSLSGMGDDPRVRDAIGYAQARDALVVAAAGDAQAGTEIAAATFPASYDGVLGVGAVDMSGTRLPSSPVGPHVDLVAPGGGVLGATRAAGHDYRDGTGFAAPFMSATAALVRARWPELSAREVAQRILATAAPAPGGPGSPAYGAGLVDPYRAVTDGLTGAAPASLPAVTPAPVDPRQARLAAWWGRAGGTARLTAAGAAGTGVLGLVTALVVVGGRGSRWRARRAAPVATERRLDEPPDEVFLLPPPEAERPVPDHDRAKVTR